MLIDVSIINNGDFSPFFPLYSSSCDQGEPGLANTDVMMGQKGEPGSFGPVGVPGYHGAKGNTGPDGQNGHYHWLPK